MITPVAFSSMQPQFDQPPADVGQAASATFTQAETIIAQVRGNLTARKNEILTLSADPRVTQWHDCNFNEFSQFMRFFKLPDTLAEARDKHPAKAVKILKIIEKCENDLGALDIDIRRKTIHPLKAAGQAQRIMQEYTASLHTVEAWQAMIALLTEADKNLRQRLVVSALLPVAKELGRRTAEMIDDGYNFYRMVKEENSGKDSPTLHDYRALAIDLEKRIRHIDLGGVSGLARTIVEHNLQVATAATDQLKEFLEVFLDNLPGEVRTVDRIQQELTGLRNAASPVILAKIETLATSLSRNLVDLRNRVQNMKQIQFLPIVLEEIRTLHYTMKTVVIPEMKRRIGEAGSIVNPASIAAEKTTEFFMGLKGLVRAVKLLFSAAGGRKAIKPEDLHRILLDILNSCDIYYGNTKTDVARLHTFIDDKLRGLDKPFPYEGLYQAAKEAISIYGARLENLLNSFETTDYSTDDKDEKPSPAHKTTVGRLIAKLEVRTANLESARI